MMFEFDQRLKAALVGGAIGDAMGAPVEGWGPRAILASFADWDFTRFIPPQGWDGKSHYWKGNGRITDDTLMVEALIDAYIESEAHLDAYGYAQYLLPRIVHKDVWVPEYQKTMPIFDRLWVPEKYPHWRLTYNNVDPRSAGVGNMCNCGVAMWIMPVGAVNVGDPLGAYQEAAAIGQAHNESFAVEAAAVLAAAFAQAFAVDRIDDVVESAISLARDGTRRACIDAIDAVSLGDDLPTFIHRVRDAVAPYDQKTEHTSDDRPLALATGTPSDIGRPSRTKSIEELPVALAVLKYGQGDFLRTLRAGVCYGRDCDSIAGMACGLYGALHGSSQLPDTLCQALAETNRRDFCALANRFEQTVRRIVDADLRRMHQRTMAMRIEPDFTA
ncbi:MAG: ADP-ribosylglycohydrolase family protein [Phycisphaeraceae bacterium]|nr:ADP-ribosylglycohydrolase family protein [Phycisphaeraceae bacterium]